MAAGFYAGHGFEWMNKFLRAIPKKQRLKLGIAYAIASAIHHQFIYKKSDMLKLSHKTLQLFGLNRKCLKPYLTAFKEAGLIQYDITKGRSPVIQLLIFPNNLYIINSSNIDQYTVNTNNSTTNGNSTTTNNSTTSNSLLTTIKDTKTLINHTGVRIRTGYGLYGTGYMSLYGQVRNSNLPTHQGTYIPTKEPTYPPSNPATYLPSKGGTHES